MAFRHETLDNGLTLLTDADPAAHTAAVGFFVRTGARDESPELMGVSHFLEHMMFKGTARRSADDVNREFDEIGANYNAFTSHEMTVYYAHVLPEFLERATDLLSDMLRPALREADFDMEKKVILEEIGMYDDKPWWVVQDNLLETHFAARPHIRSLGHRVLGTNQTVTDLTAGQMRGYFETQYAANNIVVAAAGRLDADALRAQLAEATAGWSPADVAPRPADRPNLVDGVSDHRIELSDGDLNRAYLAAALPAPSAQDPMRHAARVLCDLLGDDDNSRLHWALIDPGLAEEASIGHDAQDGTGVFLCNTVCDPNRQAEVEARFFAVLDDLVRKRDVTEAECTRAANKLATAVTLTNERPAGLMHHMGGTWTYLGEHRTLDDELDAIRSVTPTDIHDLLDAYPLAPRTIATLTP